ncbi:MAG: AMP phosphorylase [Candidatus Kariarchaeaceae archaeon]
MLEVIIIEFETADPVVFVNKDIDLELNKFARIKGPLDQPLTTLAAGIVESGQVGLSPAFAERLGVVAGDKVSLLPRTRPTSYAHIKKKFHGEAIWTHQEIREIVSDIYAGNLTDLEMSAFLMAQQYLSLDINEIEALTKSIAEYGERIQFEEEEVYDKHSIGGVPGNKVSLLIVPIVAAAGLLIPKTSSRAITSPSGTADTFEVIANVDFSAEEIQEIAPKIRGMLVWGGGVNLVPVDDMIINRIERPLSLDPRSMIIASILSKKISTSVNHLVLDMPVGIGTKIESRADAIDLGHLFVEVGRRINVQVDAALTYASQPLGHTVGPALEAEEAILTLMNKGPTSIREKATELAGILIEMGGLANRGHGQQVADSILASGKALKKFWEIVEAQGGNPALKISDLPIGQYADKVYAPKDGYIINMSNSAIKAIAKAAGAPSDKGAGVRIFRKLGEFVRAGDPLIEIIAERESALEHAILVSKQMPLVTLEGMVLERISSVS